MKWVMADGGIQPKPARKKAIGRLVNVAKDEGHPDGYVGKRGHTRYTTGMRLELTLDPNRTEEASPVVMHNVSEGGFAFWYRRELTSRTIVYLRESDGKTVGEWLPALVRHCTRGLLGYLVGAEFDCGKDAPWQSPAAATPQPALRTPDTKAQHLRRVVRRQLSARKL